MKLKPFTVICALHPTIARETDADEPVVHYTALVVAENSCEASLLGHAEASKAWKTTLKAYAELEECRGHYVSPARVLVLVIFEGHPQNLQFGWQTGLQPRESK